MTDNKIRHIGKYDIIKTLGRGGMGVVYKATDRLLGRMVAIKMITGGFADDPDLLKRFYREARSTASLRHPNIVTVYDVGDQAGEPYLVMEFLDGESLDVMINSQRELSLLEKTNYIVQICRGLQYAHDRNIIHRDIKPANIMVLGDGTVKLVDFGIARMGDDRVTRPGQVMGSVHYMAPEQIKDGDVGTGADLFATGAVLYQLLTYHLPFKGEDACATLAKILHDPPPPLSQYLAQYPPELDAILERALAKDSAERYQTADELAFDLTQVQLQLKAGIVAELLEKATASMEQGELTAAKEHLMKLLTLDPQHKPANERLRALQRQLQERKRLEQVEQLRKDAEEAGRQQQFEQAIRLISQAISLDSTNSELMRILEELNHVKNRAEFVQDRMSQARAARSADDLEEALTCLNQLLGQVPDYAAAIAMRVEVSGEIAEREKQLRIRSLLEEARGQIESQQFSKALKVLEAAAEIDPDASNLSSLLKLAKEGAEQERRQERRQRLQALTSEVEQMLEENDYAAALAHIEDGLQSFPDEPALLRLIGVAERMRETEERRELVDARIESAHRLLQARKPQEAIVVLQFASDLIERVPYDMRNRYDDLIAEIAECRQEAEELVAECGRAALRARNANPESKSAPQSFSSDTTTRELAGKPQAIRAAPSYDNPVLELTPPQGQNLPEEVWRVPLAGDTSSTDITQVCPSSGAPAAASNPVSAVPEITYATSAISGNLLGWEAETLVRVERELAVFLGPLARVLVKRAACKTNNPEELYTMLAAHLERESDQKGFLARSPGSRSLPQSPAVEETSLSRTIFPAINSALTPADVEHAAQQLARHVGPIANVLAKRAAQRADSLGMLYGLLAKHLHNDTERARFLRESGFPEL